MKKILISIAAFLIAIQVSNAQTDKGDQSLGLNFVHSNMTSNSFMADPYDSVTSTLGTSTRNINIGLNYSYFIADKLDIGADLNFGSYTGNYYDSDQVNNNYYPIKQSGKNYGGILYIRKYYLFKNRIGFRTGPYLGYTSSNSSTRYIGANALSSDNMKINDYAAGVKFELLYYASKKLGFSAQIADLEYDHTNFNNGNQGHENGDALNFGFINSGLSISVFYVFGS